MSPDTLSSFFSLCIGFAIAGTLASVGARLIEGTANKMIGQTFECIRTKLEE